MSVNQSSSLNISADSIKKLANEHSGMQVKITDAKQECGLLKNMMDTLLQAAVASSKASSKKNSLSSVNSIGEW